MTRKNKPYKVKEVFYSLQGEGARSGRAAIFCRFSQCNLWNGKEESRAKAVCSFCDTDILGTDGQNGGRFEDAQSLAQHLTSFWPEGEKSSRYLIFTGGEPMLQLDQTLLDCVKAEGFEVAVETNGTLPILPQIDWVCVSPKGLSNVVVNQCNELKLVYPQADAMPERFSNISAEHYFLSPMANPKVISGTDQVKLENTQLALKYCLQNPKWKLSLQMHKLLGID